MLLSWVQRKDTQDGLIVSVLKPEVISISIGVSFDIALQRQEICHRPDTSDAGLASKVTPEVVHSSFSLCTPRAMPSGTHRHDVSPF